VSDGRDSVTANDWLAAARGVLREAGLRSGGARELVLQELARGPCLLGVRDIDARLQARDHQIGTASIYRAIETLLDLGLIARVDTGDGTARFEPTGDQAEPHHHFVCDRCGRIVPFHASELDAVLERILAAQAVQAHRHDVLVHGACGACREPRR